MGIKFKKSASFLLVLVFLLPSIVKVEHHHEPLKIKAKKEEHGNYYHATQAKCSVCSFEFSTFSSDAIPVILAKIQPVALFFENYRSFNYSALSNYSFLLRAPPLKTDLD